MIKKKAVGKVLQDITATLDTEEVERGIDGHSACVTQ